MIDKKIVKIEFNSININSEQQEKLKDFFLSNILELSKNIQLSTLESIVITDSFTEDVIRIQREYIL